MRQLRAESGGQVEGMAQLRDAGGSEFRILLLQMQGSSREEADGLQLVGRKFLGATKHVLGAVFYLETGHVGICQHCDGGFENSDRVYRSTFREGLRREHHFVHEGCVDGFRAHLEGVNKTR